MILDSGVHKLMQDDIVNEFLGQFEQFHVQADVILGRATPPPRFLIPNRHLIVMETMLVTRLEELSQQHGFTMHLRKLIPFRTETAELPDSWPV